MSEVFINSGLDEDTSTAPFGLVPNGGLARTTSYVLSFLSTSESAHTIDADLWRNGVSAFKNIQFLSKEMSTLAKFILKVA